ncbi:hypothetical protein DFH07DRAFT_744413 [Mycena maculata]|uniref:BTB domain-containing protein n=1 Tax=Mycena maculata TaxID=230809 RepID=A0AAD7J072_9AGAR|nr:hypothetical protein DFH07DRAFT_744413 [Mycena maculata]
MEGDAELNQRQRVEELWFEDGSIIIHSGTREFRVHRGILVACSLIFRDMFLLPQPIDSETVEGCPLVCLPDSAADVTVFLKAIFYSSFFMPFPARTEFETIVGCLRLSHKYEVDYLRRRALVHLTSQYRTTLSEWDTSTYDEDDEDDPARSALDITSFKSPFGQAHEICVIELAREVDAPWLLPLAFYSLSAQFSMYPGRDVFLGAVHNGVPTSLSAEDQERFLAGHLIQTQSALAEILRFLSDPLDIVGCTSAMDCARARFRAIARAGEYNHDYPSVPLHIWGSNEWQTLDVCPTCLAVLEETHEAARQVFWDKLPEIYGLPPWEELEEMKAAAIGTAWFP